MKATNQIMSSTQQDTIWVPAPKIAAVAAVSEERLALMPLDSGRPVILTGTALQIWNRLAEQLTFNDLLACLATDFGVDGETIRPDVENFMLELQRQALIVPLKSPASGTARSA